MPKELVAAPESVIEAVIERAVRPCVETLERERGCQLPLVLTQWLSTAEGPSLHVGTSPGQSSASTGGEARLSFRKNYGGDRFLFRVQAIYPKDFTPDTAFSGFQIVGGVDMEGDTPVRVKYGTWAVLWNDFEFSRWV